MVFAPIARVVLVFVLLAGSCVPAFSQSSDLEAAKEALKQGQLPTALERVNTYLAGHPKDARARFLKGVIFTEQKKTDDAFKIFVDLTHDYPELPEPYNNLAVLYAGQGKYEKARAALEMAIRANPRYAAAYENLGDIYAKMAAQSYAKAVGLNRDNKSAAAKLNLIRDLLSKSGN